jgi:hypothetical protein
VTPGSIALERHLAGIGLALVSAVFIGIGVAGRGKSRGDDSRPALILGAIIAALLAAPFADPLSLDAEQAMWMSLLGLIVLRCALVLLFLGPRYIHASRVTFIALLEAVLAPIWPGSSSTSSLTCRLSREARSSCVRLRSAHWRPGGANCSNGPDHPASPGRPLALPITFTSPLPMHATQRRNGTSIQN